MTQTSHRKVVASGLPDTNTLYEKYRVNRDKYFGDRIPLASDVIIEWSSRMTSSAGNCRIQRNKFTAEMVKPIIRLSTQYHQKYPYEIESTLLHEMIHILAPGHGPEFKRWVSNINQLGGKVTRHSKEPAAPPKWEYFCLGCGKKIYRRRRFKKLTFRSYKCKLCGGRWQENKLP